MKINSLLKKIKNEIHDAALCNIENNDVSDILLALTEGKKNIDITFTAFGIEFQDTYNLAGMLDFLIPLVYIDIDNFMSTPNSDNYNNLLNGFFIGVIADISSLKFSDHVYGSVFDTDVCLNILFSMLYCDKEIQRAIFKKLSFLKETNLKKEGKATFYSSDTLLPLVYYFYSKLHKNEDIPLSLDNILSKKKKKMAEDIYKNLTPLYKSAIENYDNKDTNTFSGIINDMCDYHLKNSKDDYSLEFNNLRWQYFPIEILFLLKERHKAGLSIEGINHPLINDFLPYFLNNFEISEQNQNILKLVMEEKD